LSMWQYAEILEASGYTRCQDLFLENGGFLGAAYCFLGFTRSGKNNIVALHGALIKIGLKKLWRCLVLWFYVYRMRGWQWFGEGPLDRN
jgi:hypothetical protein